MKIKHHLVIVLDQSGSMDSIRKQAVDSFNEQIQTAKAKVKDFDICVTLVLFNYDIHFLKISEPIEQIQELAYNDYRPNGGTALNDAVGIAIDKVKEWAEKLPESPDVLFCIISDGYENSSKKYPGIGNKELAELVQTMQSKHAWTFTYAGTNDFDVSKVGQQLNIPQQNIQAFARSDAGTKTFASAHSRGLNNYYDYKVTLCNSGGNRSKSSTVSNVSVCNFYSSSDTESKIVTPEQEKDGSAGGE